YRPGQEQQIALVRRLKKAGATRVFVGGDRSDVAIMARDAQSEKIPLTFMGGDAMRASNQPLALADGAQTVALPDYAALPAAQPTVDAMRAARIEPDGYILPSAAAVSIADQAATAAKAENKPIVEKLVGTTFQTPIGPVSFGKNHELTENPFRLQEWRGNAFVPLQPPSN
ncbi:MAG: ABC transporter substrate-binding protein, partial [Rhizobiaceae bacterium]|nr:ABC transporter substrate-binding protein [Rhizobiaceae bacterium]